MKKKMMILAMLAGLGACLLVGACVQTPDLAQPTNLKIVDEVLTWDAVESAEGYVVDIDGEIYETETNRLDIFLLTAKPKTFEMKVFAYRDGENEADSAWSETIEYTVENNESWGIKPTEDGEGYQFTVLDPTLMKGKFVMPSEIDGLPITQIVSSAFGNCTELTAVILPDNVEEIGYQAFYGCSALARVQLPQNNIIELSATFKDCTSLKTVDLPDSLQKLNGTFNGCTSLTEIEIPEGVETLSDGAFQNCSSLTEIEIPSTVNFTNGVFYGCTSLRKITVAGGNEWYKAEGNCLIRIKDNLLISGISTSKIPASVKSIGYGAFFNIATLTEIEIPGSVEVVSNSAFAGCSGLKKVTIAEGVKQLGTTPGTVGTIFSNCGALESLHLPSTVEYVCPDVVSWRCPNLKTLTVAEGNPVYKSEGNCIIQKSDNVLVAGCVGSVIPSYVKEIGIVAFYGLGAESFVIPEGVEKIGDSAFSESTLVTIECPSTLKIIGKCAFMYCGALKNVVLKEGLERIEEAAFYSSSIETINFPESLQFVDKFAFGGCFNLKGLKFPEGCYVHGSALMLFH